MGVSIGGRRKRSTSLGREEEEGGGEVGMEGWEGVRLGQELREEGRGKGGRGLLSGKLSFGNDSRRGIGWVGLGKRLGFRND